MFWGQKKKERIEEKVFRVENAFCQKPWVLIFENEVLVPTERVQFRNIINLNPNRPELSNKGL